MPCHYRAGWNTATWGDKSAPTGKDQSGTAINKNGKNDAQPNQSPHTTVSGRGFDLRLPDPAEELVVATVDGIFVLVRSDAGWTVADRALEGCFVSAVTTLADGTLIAGLHGQGLARSDDGGRSWQWINSGITQFDVWSVRAGILAGKEVVLAVTMPAALFCSEDSGENWRALPSLTEVPSRPKWTFPPPPHLGHVKDIVVSDERLLIAIEVGAVLSSRDGGLRSRTCRSHRTRAAAIRTGSSSIATVPGKSALQLPSG